jgi:hypothetical protein
MSSVKIFSSALKAAVSKINSIVSDMDEKVDTFAEQVLDIFVDYEENLFKCDEDKADIKQKIVGLFEMFQPEKRAASVSGYNIFCKEQREAVKAKNPELSASAILGALGAEWKALDKDEKEEWNAKAKLANPMSAEEKSAKRSASRKPAEKKEKVKCAYDGCDKCPKEPKQHTDGNVYCAKHLDKVILAEAKSPKTSPKTEAKPEPKSNKNKSVSKKTEVEKKTEVSAKEKLEKKLEEANKKLAEKTSAVSAPTGAKGAEAGKAGKPITVSPKTSAKPAAATIKKTTFDFTSEPKTIGENLDFWATKRVKLDKTSDKKWRYNAATGLCFEDNDDFTLAATWVDGAVAWLDAIPEEVKEWARNSGCNVPSDEDDDIELDGEFSDDE